MMENNKDFESYIKKHYKKDGATKIAQYLNCAESTIYKYAKQMKLTKECIPWSDIEEEVLIDNFSILTPKKIKNKLKKMGYDRTESAIIGYAKKLKLTTDSTGGGEYLTSRDIQEMMNFSKEKLEGIVRRGILKPKMFKGNRRFRIKDFEIFLKEKENLWDATECNLDILRWVFEQNIIDIDNKNNWLEDKIKSDFEQKNKPKEISSWGDFEKNFILENYNIYPIKFLSKMLKKMGYSYSENSIEQLIKYNNLSLNEDITSYYIGSSDLQDILGFSSGKLNNFVRKGYLSASKHNGKRIYKIKDIIIFLKENLDVWNTLECDMDMLRYILVKNKTFLNKKIKEEIKDKYRVQIENELGLNDIQRNFISKNYSIYPVMFLSRMLKRINNYLPQQTIIQFMRINNLKVKQDFNEYYISSIDLVKILNLPHARLSYLTRKGYINSLMYNNKSIYKIKDIELFLKENLSFWDTTKCNIKILRYLFKENSVWLEEKINDDFKCEKTTA